MRTVQPNVRLERGLTARARTAASERSVSLAVLVAAGLAQRSGGKRGGKS
ncbi:MAG: hypothetical protein ACYCZN_12125 [Candidatus Dormibacteria bacterium]